MEIEVIKIKIIEVLLMRKKMMKLMDSPFKRKSHY